MRFSRDQLAYMALAALHEIAETSVRSPAPKSQILRFTLAYLFEASSADSDKEWLFRNFWKIATSEPKPCPTREWEEYYCRSRDMTMCMRAFIRELGFEDVVIEKLDEERRAGSPDQGRNAHDQSGRE